LIINEKRILFTLLLCVVLFAVFAHSGLKADDLVLEKANDDFVIGLIPERNIFKQLARYEPLMQYLSKVINKRIKTTVLTRYGNIIENFIDNKMDAAFFGSFSYVLTHAQLEIEPIARPLLLNGRSTYSGFLFVRRDSDIASVSAMKGKRFVFVDKATTAGFLFPLGYLKDHGVTDYKNYFSEIYFAGTHEYAIYDVLNKKADIGAAKNTIYESLAEKDERIYKELVILEKSTPVPENALAVKPEIDPLLKRKLKDALLNLHEEPSGQKILQQLGAERFIETTDQDYAGVYVHINKINFDLKNYKYLNN